MCALTIARRPAMNNHEKEIGEYKAKVAKLESELEQVVYCRSECTGRQCMEQNLYDVNVNFACGSKPFLNLDFNNVSCKVKSVKIFVELKNDIKHFEFKREEEKSDEVD
jgi:hypothetical protein